jgi:hypothetical protein
MKKFAISFLIWFIMWFNCIAGPPFDTDDPEPVPFRHWEFYLSSVQRFQPGSWSGTLPHFEVNYGVVHDVQLHVLAPVNYTYVQGKGTSYGYQSTEFGIKYRFLKETDNRPQVGTFPIFEVPFSPDAESLKIFLPLWIQKSWDKFTTYGGAGYWINTGKDSRNSVFAGWEAQYDLSETLMLGGELYFQTPDIPGGKSTAGFNAGGSVNFNEKADLIFSVGHSIGSENSFSAYIGFLITI